MDLYVQLSKAGLSF